MEKLIKKVDKLKKEIDNQYQAKIETLNKKIKNDSELVKEIEEYKRTNDERLKEKIINNKVFQEYKDVETDINLLIMQINSRLKKEIISDKRCI